jgi:hypothetical protein
VIEDRSKPYRCSVPAEDCSCTVRVSGSELICSVFDLSREDFRVKVPWKYVRKLEKARHIELLYHGERWSVRFNQIDPDQTDVVLLDRIEELTRIKPPSPWHTLDFLRMSQETDPRFVLAVLVAFIAVCVSMPGIGDRLGTAPKIKGGVQTVLKSFW